MLVRERVGMNCMKCEKPLLTHPVVFRSNGQPIIHVIVDVPCALRMKEIADRLPSAGLNEQICLATEMEPVFARARAMAALDQKEDTHGR